MPVIALITAAALLIAISANTDAATDDTASARVTQSTHKQGDGRENAAVIRETRDAFDAQTSTGRRSAKQSPGGQQKSRSVQSAAPNTDFWFYLADVELYADDDRDGFYSGIDLLFDVDTYYSAAEIYAVAYLSYEGGPWEEYAVTEDFTIFGSSGTDDYVLVTDLVAGYPTGDYDLLIAIVKSARRRAEAAFPGSTFHVIYESDVDDSRSEQILTALREDGIPVEAAADVGNAVLDNGRAFGIVDGIPPELFAVG